MDSRIENAPKDVPLKRDHDSVDDFEHLGHDSSPDDRSDHQQHQHRQSQPQTRLIDVPRVDDLLHIGDSFQVSESVLPSALIAEADDIETRPVPATPPPSADFDKYETMAQSSDPFQRSLDPVDPKLASMAFVETERFHHPTAAAQFRENDDDDDDEMGLRPPLLPVSSSTGAVKADSDVLPSSRITDEDGKADVKAPPIGEFDDIIAALGTDQGKKRYKDENTKPSGFGIDDDFAWNMRSSAPPIPEKSPLVDFLGSDSAPSREDRGSKNIMDDDSWNVVERTDVRGREQFEPPTKPLPPLPKEAELLESGRQSEHDASKDLLIAEAAKEPPQARSVEHEFAKRRDAKPKEPDYVPSRSSSKKKEEIEIAPKEIFRDMGLDAWFNPERLNPTVAGLIYWRNPKESGIVFGTILGVLLSLAYFSLISVLAYLSLLALTGSVIFRIYKTVLQAVQKTSDGHPFKDILEMDLTLPAEKVHEVVDVAIAHTNATVSELRRLFLVEDFLDSLKFGVLMWCLTSVGSWFNGMTLIIIGVVALFTLPKIYETNQEQIDQNLALVQAKINEITAKVKAAIPLGKKAEPTKEE